MTRISVDEAFSSSSQENGQGQVSDSQFRHEVIGNLYGVTFDISSTLPVGTFRLDRRICQPLKPWQSSQTIREIISEHSVLEITFSWDLRERAREIFHLLACGFEPFKETIYPRNVV